MNSTLKTLYGLKFNPFLPGLPTEALFATPAIDTFCRRLEFGLADGGFAMITGDPGSGKSAAMRILASRLARRSDLLVGIVERPVGRASDFYREAQQPLRGAAQDPQQLGWLQVAPRSLE